jgi:hypothetical protein
LDRNRRGCPFILVCMGNGTAMRIEELHMCTFEPDERMEALRNKWIQYYKDTDCCSNQQALQYRKTLRHWIACGGYTSTEVNQVKRSIPPSPEEVAEYENKRRWHDRNRTNRKSNN